MLTRFLTNALLGLSLAGGLCACAPAGWPIDVLPLTPTPAPTSTLPAPPVYVESIELVTRESFPVQITAIVRGNLPDACTVVAETQQSRVDHQFTLTFVTTRPVEMACAAQLTPFEMKIALDVHDLPAGIYQVVAAGVITSFTLTQANTLPQEAQH